MKMKHRFIRYIALGLLLSTTTIAVAEIYKWQSDDGTWHFSEVPPNRQAVETIDIRVSPPSGEVVVTGEEAEDTTTEQKTSDGPMPLSPELAAAKTERLKQNCELAKTNLSNLTNRSQIRYEDKEKGVVRHLTEDERQEWIEKSKAPN